jgi:hypothetical protein
MGGKHMTGTDALNSGAPGHSFLANFIRPSRPRYPPAPMKTEENALAWRGRRGQGARPSVLLQQHNGNPQRACRFRRGGRVYANVPENSWSLQVAVMPIPGECVGATIAAH